MNNQEKAKEISRLAQDTQLGRSLFAVSFPMGNRYVEDIEKSALATAEWKDKQIAECLEKLQERFVEHDRHPDWLAVQEIIDKFSKKD